MATSMKMTGCMKIVSKMSEADQDALLSRLDTYQNDGVPPERAQLMAAQDMLAELQGERESLFGLLREQHPDLFTVSEEPVAVEEEATTEETPEITAAAEEAPAAQLSTRRNIYGEQLLANWTAPTDSKADTALYYLQNKQIDLKRVIEGVTAATGQIDEKWNAYLKEELYHGRTAKATKDFMTDELRPLLQNMQRAGVSMDDFETYLHNRHAEERNVQIASINPAMPDGGSGIDTADARSYLAGLDPAKRQAMESLAKRVDAITKETRELLVRSGLETRETIDAWEQAYGKYVPLMREDLDFSADLTASGTGQGFSVKGPSSKRATGSKREVVDIMANLAMQRERAIVRAEKSRVGTALYGLALKNPNPDFWLAVNPDAIKDPQALMQELQAMGLDPLDAKAIAEEPKQTYVDPRTGLVSQRINPAMRSRDNVLAVRINGQDRFLFFNTKDERAKRMVASLKNLDADQLGAVLGGVVAPVTRWFASVNTQYNPIFGAVNLIRDTQGALVNLSTTEIADRKAQVFAGIPGALAGIYSALRKERKGNQAQGQWADLWEDFQKAGGPTGYRDMFKTSDDRAKALETELKKLTEGKAMAAGRGLFNWLSDYNEALENAVRLSAYKAAIDKGVSREQAASIAKNLTVNFNRKGQVATQAGALYAFFNAAVQGTTRLGETIKGPAGRKIMAGGLLLGTMQALLLAAAGFDEDEPPEFVKERNLVIPLGESGKYLQIPMPLGLHVIPSTSRIMTEWFMSGFKDTPKRVASLANLYLEAFNPVGNASTLTQTLSPTIADPMVALGENKDWQGRPIFKEDRSNTDPTPGYTRARDTATWISKELAYYLNLASGGTKYQKGVFSPTPDQIDYLFAQAGGGVVRELQKISQAAQSTVTGEELPSYKIPVGGRFFGDIKEQSAVQSRFYDNLKRLNEHEREIEGRRKNREGGIQEYLRENPEARLANIADRTEREVQELRRRRREMIEKDRPKESIKMIEAQITRKMQQLNDRMEKLEEATQ